jgi:hypothetical protein
MRGVSLLFAVVTFWLVGDGLENKFPVCGLNADQSLAVTDCVNFFGLEDINIGGLAPNQSRPLFLTNVGGFIWTESHRLNGTYAVGTHDSFDEINFDPWFREIEVIRDISIKIFDGAPWDKFGRSSPTRVEKLRLEGIRDDFPIFVRLNDFIHYMICDDCPKLFSGIELGVVRDPILLVDEPVAYGRSRNQEKGEDSNGPRPFNHRQVEQGLGALAIAAALWAIWWGIFHFIYTDNRKWVVASALSPIILGLGLICCGLWLVSS